GLEIWRGFCSALAQSTIEWPDERANARPACSAEGASPSMPRPNRSCLRAACRARLRLLCRGHAEQRSSTMPKTGDAQHRKGSERSEAPRGRREAEPGELRRFEPVSDVQVLAAVERAERHQRREKEGVLRSE